MRIIDADALKEHISKIVKEEGQIDPKWAIGLNYANRIIDNFPSLEPFDRPQGELTEIKHRLNLLIGVLYTNQLITESDLKYIENSIKKLMRGNNNE